MKTLTRCVAAAAVLSLLACKDSTGPTSFNAATLDSQMQALSGTFDGNAAFQSLLTLSPLFPTLTAPPAFRATVPLILAGPARLAVPLRLAPGMARMAAPRAPGAGMALFPVNVLGKTIVWDTLIGGYRVDSVITGAPSNGVRIRLYAVNPMTSKPVVPLQFLGYVDLKDQSSAQADVLGVTLVLGATTVADYAITRTVGTNSAGITIVGFLTAADGTDQVTFNHSLQITGGTLAWVSTLNSATTGVALEVHGDTLGNGTEVLTLTHQGNTLEFSGVASAGSFTATLLYNGSQFATLTVVSGNPVYTGVNGHTLSFSDQQHLTSLLVGIELVVLTTFAGLLGPFLVVSAFSLPG